MLPELHEKDLRAALERLYELDAAHALAAFHGTGVEQELRLEKAVVQVRPVRSELELREQLVELDADTRVAFLVPFESDIPFDLRGRFAQKGRVMRIGATLRLRRMFGATEVDPEARADELGRYLARRSGDVQFPATHGRLTRDAMWETWLRHALGLDAVGGLSLAGLLAFVARDAKGPGFVADLEARGDGALAVAFGAYAATKVGPIGARLVEAWTKGRGRTAIELALLAEAIAKLPSTSRETYWLQMQLKHELGIADATEAAAAIVRLGGEVGAALFELYRGDGTAERHKLYETAQQRVDDDLVRSALVLSTRLPLAFRARLEAFGSALERGVEARDASSFEVARLAYLEIERHELARQEPGLLDLRRADRALRLLAFLVVGSADRLEEALSPVGEAEALSRWYVAEGGYVDWARYQARGPEADSFGRGIARVVHAVDAVREALDVRFAKALQKWIEADRPSHHLVPIERALDRVAVPFLDAHPERRLLVLLIDGMAWAQAVELLLDMSRPTAPSPWAPLAWRGWAKGTTGHHPTVLAALPTITEVSRAAFFAGAMVPDGPSQSTDKDVERFAQHKGLGKFCPGASAPRLMLQGEAFGTDGHLKQPARTLIADEQRRVVGVVVNAIDDSLKGNPQVDRSWSVDKIRALWELLELARQAGRTILLASDHGHVPSDRLKRIGDIAGGGARWRPWKNEGDAVMEQELVFRRDGVRVPKGAAGVVLPIDDRARYGSQLHAGEHGGATLAEVVTPCLLLGCVLQEHHDDASTRVVAMEQPRWWQLEVREKVALLDETPAPRPTKKKPVAENQLSLLAPEPAPKPTAPEAGTPIPATQWPMAAPLLKSELFEVKAPRAAAMRNQVLASVDFLLGRNGVASVEAFAAAVGIVPFRVGGFIAQLQGVLNVDGYQVLAYDPQSKTVRLHGDKLGAQFGVVLGGSK